MGMSLYWIRVGPKSNGRCLSERNEGDADAETQERWPGDDRTRDWGGVAASHRVSAMAGNPRS